MKATTPLSSERSGRSIRRFRCRSFALLGLFVALALGGCASGGPPASTLTALVLSEPPGLIVSQGGKTLGKTPLELPVLDLEQAASLTVEKDDGQVIERRIQILSAEQIRVILTVSDQPSDLAKALGLTDVIVFDYGQRALFETDSYDLDPSVLPELGIQAELLKDQFESVEIHVCGHTDSTGEDDHNRVLSVRRAQAVADALETSGVDADRMVIQGFGPDYPLAPNETEEGKALNRRTEIIIGQ